MRYYIHKENGYVLAFGTGQGFEEIDEEQYSNLMNVIKNKLQYFNDVNILKFIISILLKLLE